MSLKAFVILAFSVLFTIITPLTAAAQEAAPIGTVMEVEGRAFVTRPGTDKIRAAEINTEIYLNDLIETDYDSRTLILFIDNTEITLGSNSILIVDEYIFDVDNMRENKGRFSILRGVFVFVSGLISKLDNPDVRIDTRYGSIGIRGTSIWGGVLDLDSGYAAERTAGPGKQFGLLVQKGEISFETDGGSEIISAGYGTFVKSRNSVPSLPKAWPKSRVVQAFKKISLMHHDEIRKRIEIRKRHHKAMRERYKRAVELRKKMLEEKTKKTGNRAHFGGADGPDMGMRGRIDNRLQLDDKEAIKYCHKHRLPCQAICRRMAPENRIRACNSSNICCGPARGRTERHRQ